jgi:hypothetical protein
MSTFYLLPPRPLLGQQFARFLEGYFPDLRWDAAQRGALAEALSVTASTQAGVVVVFREDVPEGVDLGEALIDDFGAEAGDEVVEVSPKGVHRWRVAGCAKG